jgi:hypothetical protein
MLSEMEGTKTDEIFEPISLGKNRRPYQKLMYSTAIWGRLHGPQI